MASRALKRRHNLKKNDKPKVAGLILLCSIILVCIIVSTAFTGIVKTSLKDLPDYSDMSVYNEAHPTVIYASDRKTVLAEMQVEWREPVAMRWISQYVLDGTVATEDARFYSHNGVDVKGVLRAFVNNILGGDLEGASTITQQLVRNTVLSKEMTDISLARKIREMHISLELEKQYSKEEILNMYLNTINYGCGAYGIEAASKRYFSKHADELTLAEAAALVGIPQSPTHNNPVDNLENCIARRNLVLDRMYTNGYISKTDRDKAVVEPLVLNETEREITGIAAYPYFTEYVRNQLESKYAYSRDALFAGGLEVYTTLDVDVQKDAEAAVDEKLASVGEPYEIALVAIDPDNGYIRAMIGGKDFNATQVNMATGEGGSGRQSGSSAKTFTLVSAIEEGIDPETLIDAGPTVSFPLWNVENIDKHDYGTKSIADAFAVSSNTAFARLIMYLSPERVNAVAHKMGITSSLMNTGAVTLGASEVNPLEMADAYATLANGGIHYDPECIEQVIDSKSGRVVIDNTRPKGEQVMSPEVAAAAVDVMRGVVEKEIGTGKLARLANGQVAAGKTGTSENYKDSWFCGITPQYSVAIWMGDRAPLSVAKPITVSCTDVFSNFLNRALAGSELESFPVAKKVKYLNDVQVEKYQIGSRYTRPVEEEKPDEGA